MTITITTTTEGGDMTSRINSLEDLQEMSGNDCTIAEAALVRDALIAAGVLDWTGDAAGGELADMTDGDFYALVAEACKTDQWTKLPGVGVAPGSESYLQDLHDEETS